MNEVGRSRKLTDEEIRNIQIAFQLDETLTKREIAFRYCITTETLRKYLKLKIKGVK